MYLLSIFNICFRRQKMRILLSVARSVLRDLSWCTRASSSQVDFPANLDSKRRISSLTNLPQWPHLVLSLLHLPLWSVPGDLDSWLPTLQGKELHSWHPPLRLVPHYWHLDWNQQHQQDRDQIWTNYQGNIKNLMYLQRYTE